jgi:hypothetical protein
MADLTQSPILTPFTSLEERYGCGLMDGDIRQYQYFN